MTSINDLRTIERLKRSKIYTLTKTGISIKSDGFKRTLKKIHRNDGHYYSLNAQKIIKFEKNDLYIVVENKNDYNILKKSKELKEVLNKNDFKLKIILIVNKNINDGQYDSLILHDFINNFRYKAFIYYKPKKYNENLCNGCIVVNSIKDIVDNINSLEFIKLYANYCNQNNVSIRTGTFLTTDGKDFYSGGAERYLIDLNAILEKKGINMDIYQDGEIDFFRKYKNINVIALPYTIEDKNVTLEKMFLERNISYIYAAKNISQLTVYSAFFECYPLALSPSIGISHGIAWDNIANVWVDGIHFDVDKNNIIKSAQMCDKLVSVDTNTCNWFQTLDYKLGANKFSYIPNYVDIEEFKPRDDYLKENKKIIITYPRRLYAARGLYLMLNITEKLIKKHNNIEVHFVGKGFKEDLDNVDKLIKKYPKNVFCYSKEPDKMYEVYRYTDISVIPTIMSEGTSLSCLEALASGNIVVATRIGGLSDLIINKYNGYLTEPNEDSLYETLDEIISNYKDNLKYKKNAREVAKAFNKNSWNEKWEKIFDEFKLKKTMDKKVELVEYRVNDFEKINDKLKNSIIKDLKDNKLVYVFCNNKNIKDIMQKYQAQRLQIIDSIDETILLKHKIYKESDFKR